MLGGGNGRLTPVRDGEDDFYHSGCE